ncbi:MAG: MATE family efflux transporter [Malacoplasma sp.]
MKNFKKKEVRFNFEKWFGNKAFIISMFSLFLPAALQSLITTSVIYVDNFFIAAYANAGTIAKTSIGVATSVINFPTMVIIGTLTGIGVMTSQYYGSKNNSNLHQTITIKLIMGLLLSLPIMLFLMLMPKDIIEASSGIDKNSLDPEQQLQNQLTEEYLFWSALTFIPMALAMTLSFSFKETKRPKIALLAAFIAIASNIIMDPLLVINSSGDLESVRNIALSTFGARCIEFVVLLCFIIFNKKDILRISNWRIQLSLFKNVMKNSWQPILNDSLYGFATLFLIVCLLRFDTGIHDASTTVALIVQFTVIIFPGMASSSSVLIGSELGSNNIQQAKDNSKYLIVWGTIICFIFALILFIFSWFINGVLSPNASAESLKLTQEMEWVMMPIILSQGIFSILYFAIRAGGSKFAFFTDGLIMSIWCIVFGALTLTNSLKGLNPLLYFFLLEFNQIAKMILSFFIYKYTNWARNITNDSKSVTVQTN